MRRLLCLGWMCTVSALAWGADPVTPEFESLPRPRMEGGRPLMEVLRDRKSTREFSAEPVTREQLANLLWAGFGVNRPQTLQRTAPCTMNLRCIDIYVATADGTYHYDAEAHRLVVVGRKDVRTLTGGQDYVKIAPVAFVYVADHTKLATKVESPAERSFYAAVDAGLITENVYLCCASEGLGSVIHMPGDRAALAQALHLRPEQQIVLAHTVGHPAK